jgi:RND family efflux transporter MFP subunit
VSLGCSNDQSAFPAIGVSSGARPVEVAEARAVAGPEADAFSGVLRAPEEVGVGFRVGGTITALRVDIGDRVRPGETLGTLDASRYRLAFRRARAEVRGAVAASEQAESELARTRELFDAEAATERQLERAQRQAETTASRLEAARRRMSRARLELGWTTLEAPAGGDVAARLAEPGETVRAGEPVLTLAAGDALEVEVEVPGALVTGLERGDVVDLLVPGRDARFEAVVTEVARSTREDAALFPVIARLREDAEGLRPGMSVTARFGAEPSSSPGGPVVVPPAAVVADRSGVMHVFTLSSTTSTKANGQRSLRAQRRDVEVLRVGASGAVVEGDGLEPGTRVVAAGADGMESGVRVRPSDALVRVPPLVPSLEARGVR